MEYTKADPRRSKFFQNLLYIECGGKRYTKDDLAKYIESHK
jgi:hypothetical protein